MITGGSGFVGRNLADFFASRYSVITTHFQNARAANPDSVQLDITDSAAVLSVFERVKPMAVIHAAGNKNVRFCEAQPEEAHRVNARGTQNVARACARFGAHLTYLSTDLVFESVRGNYREDETPQPTLAYGQSKLQGEIFAREELPEVAICRGGGIYGKGSPLLTWFLSEIRAGRKVECPVDIFNTPTYAQNLAEMMEALMLKRFAGVLHTVGRERVSRFEFFSAYANSLELDSGALSAVSSAHMKDTLLLQPDSSLSSERTVQQLGIQSISIAEGFARLKANGGA